MVGVEPETLEWVVGEEQATVEIDPVGERREGRRAGDADLRLFHAAEEGPKSESAGALEHPFGRPDAAAFGQLHVDPIHDPDQPFKVLGGDAALVGDDRQGRTLLQPVIILVTDSITNITPEVILFAGYLFSIIFE